MYALGTLPGSVPVVNLNACQVLAKTAAQGIRPGFLEGLGSAIRRGLGGLGSVSSDTATWLAALVPPMNATQLQQPTLVAYNAQLTQGFNAQVPAGLQAAAAAGFPGWINNSYLGGPVALGLAAAPGYVIGQWIQTPANIWYTQIPASDPVVQALLAGTAPNRGSLVNVYTYSQAVGGSAMAGGLPIVKSNIPLGTDFAYAINSNATPVGAPATRSAAAAAAASVASQLPGGAAPATTQGAPTVAPQVASTIPVAAPATSVSVTPAQVPGPAAVTQVVPPGNVGQPAAQDASSLSQTVQDASIAAAAGGQPVDLSQSGFAPQPFTGEGPGGIPWLWIGVGVAALVLLRR